MSQISDEIADLITKNKLAELNNVKNQMNTQDYEKSEQNIVSSRDSDSLEIENILNQIKDPKLLSLVISNLKVDIEGGKNFTDSSGKINIGKIAQSIERIQKKYELRQTTSKSGMAFVAATVVIDGMIKNYSDLSNTDIMNFINSYDDMTLEQKRIFLETQSKQIEAVSEKVKDPKQKEQLKKFSRSLSSNQDIRSEYVQKFKKLSLERQTQINNTEQHDIEQILKKLSDKDRKQFLDAKSSYDNLEGVDKYITGLKIKKKIRLFLSFRIPQLNAERERVQSYEINKQFRDYCDITELADIDYNRLKEALKEQEDSKKNKMNSKLGNNVGQIEDKKKPIEETILEINNSKTANKMIFAQDEEKPIEEIISSNIESFVEKASNDGIDREKIGKALLRYKQALEDEEIVEDLVDLSAKGMEEGLKGEFDEPEMEDVKDLLDSLAEMNYDDRFFDILDNPDNLSFLLEQIDKTLETTLGREEVTEEISQDTTQPIQSSDADTIYMNGQEMTVDKEWLARFQSAQEEGRDLEEVYNEYIQELLREEEEKKAGWQRREPDKREQTSEKEEISSDDILDKPEEHDEISAEEEQIDSTEGVQADDVEDTTSNNSDNGNEVFQKIGDTGKVARKTYVGNNLTNIQIFNPVAYVKSSKLRTSDIKEQEEYVKRLVKDKEDKAKTDEKGENSSQEGPEEK